MSFKPSFRQPTYGRELDDFFHDLDEDDIVEHTFDGLDDWEDTHNGRTAPASASAASAAPAASAASRRDDPLARSIEALRRRRKAWLHESEPVSGTSDVVEPSKQRVRRGLGAGEDKDEDEDEEGDALDFVHHTGLLDSSDDDIGVGDNDDDEDEYDALFGGAGRARGAASAAAAQPRFAKPAPRQRTGGVGPLRDSRDKLSSWFTSETSSYDEFVRMSQELMSKSQQLSRSLSKDRLQRQQRQQQQQQHEHQQQQLRTAKKAAWMGPSGGSDSNRSSSDEQVQRVSSFLGADTGTHVHEAQAGKPMHSRAYHAPAATHGASSGRRSEPAAAPITASTSASAAVSVRSAPSPSHGSEPYEKGHKGRPKRVVLGSRRSLHNLNRKLKSARTIQKWWRSVRPRLRMLLEHRRTGQQQQQRDARRVLSARGSGVGARADGEDGSEDDGEEDERSNRHRITPAKPKRSKSSSYDDLPASPYQNVVIPARPKEKLVALLRGFIVRVLMKSKEATSTVQQIKDVQSMLDELNEQARVRAAEDPRHAKDDDSLIAQMEKELVTQKERLARVTSFATRRRLRLHPQPSPIPSKAKTSSGHSTKDSKARKHTYLLKKRTSSGTSSGQRDSGGQRHGTGGDDGGADGGDAEDSPDDQHMNTTPSPSKLPPGSDSGNTTPKLRSKRRSPPMSLFRMSHEEQAALVTTSGPGTEQHGTTGNGFDRDAADSGTNDSSPKPKHTFLKRRSQRMPMQKLDWSKIKPKTDARLPQSLKKSALHPRPRTAAAGDASKPMRSPGSRSPSSPARRKGKKTPARRPASAVPLSAAVHASSYEALAKAADRGKVAKIKVKSKKKKKKQQQLDADANTESKPKPKPKPKPEANKSKRRAKARPKTAAVESMKSKAKPRDDSDLEREWEMEWERGRARAEGTKSTPALQYHIPAGRALHRHHISTSSLQRELEEMEDNLLQMNLEAARRPRATHQRIVELESAFGELQSELVHHVGTRANMHLFALPPSTRVPHLTSVDLLFETIESDA